jgi:DNA transposition AAA+ family ATPase
MKDNTDQAEKAALKEIVEIATRIGEWQARHGLSDSALLRAYPDLGSSKTWWAAKKGELSEGYDLDEWLTKYRAAWTVIESIPESTPDEDLYDDLSCVLALRRTLLETFAEADTGRVILVEGESGTGKTKALAIMRMKYGQRLTAIEASDAWGDNPMALLGSILIALGAKMQNLPAGRYERMEKVVELLREPRRCVAIDEGHHLGPHTLNTLKTLVNRTPGEFLVMAMPTLWRALERGAYEEARQLTRNRLAERVKLGLNVRDVEKVVTRRVPALNGCAGQAAKMIAEKAAGFGNLAFVRDVCRRLVAMAQTGDLAIADVAKAVEQEIRSR